MVTKILDGCDFYPDIGIDVHIKKSLITVNKDNKLSMHDLLQEMGRKIVRQKSPNELGKRCRLWEDKDIHNVLTENTATEAVQGIVNDYTGEQKRTLILSVDAFLKMKKLRLLRVLNPTKSCDLKYLSNELRLLEWHQFPSTSLPSSFQPENLVALFLPESRIEKLWKPNMPLHKLKLVDLKGSNLVITPDFRMTPNLESLVLEGTRIADVHPTVRFLRRLKLLNLRNCKSLKSFPTKIGKESLEILILSGCSKIERIPEIVGEMECLQNLCLDGTGIKELPSSIGHLRSLVFLNLKDCSKLVSLPSSIAGCAFLKTLNLSGCSKLENLPENLRQVESLEELDLSETPMTVPPSFIFHMKNLQVLSLQGCKGPPSRIRSHWPFILKATQRLGLSSMTLTLPSIWSGLSTLKRLNLSDCNLCDGVIPNDFCSLSSLEILHLCRNNFITLPTTLSRLSKLTHLALVDCNRLKSLPELPASTDLWIDGCVSLEVVAHSTSACHSRVSEFICALNCFKLAEDNNAVAMLKRRLKVAAKTRKQSYNIIVPESEVTQWFSHQTDESSNSIKIPLPPNFLNDSKLMGFVICCVFFSDFVNKPQMREHISCRRFIHGRNYCREVGRGCLLHFPRRSTRVTKDHLCLKYLPCDSFSECDKTEISSSIDRAEESFEIEFLFEIFGNHSKMKKCGVRMLYEKDLEEMDQIINDHSRPTSSNFDDVRSNDGSSGNIGAPVKRKWLIHKAGDQRQPYFCRFCQANIKKQR